MYNMTEVAKPLILSLRFTLMLHRASKIGKVEKLQWDKNTTESDGTICHAIAVVGSQ